MRVSSRHSFLCIEREGTADEPVVWRLEAEMSGENWRFAFIDCRLRVPNAEEARTALAQFEAREIQRFHIMLPDGGWLRVKRDVRGYVLIGYHLTRVRSGAAVHGEVVVEPGSGTNVCKEFQDLL